MPLHASMQQRSYCGVRKFTGYSSEILNTLCAEESAVDSASDDSSVSVVCEVTFALVV